MLDSLNATSTRGPLVLIGGAEDKKGPRTVLRETVCLNGAGSAVVIPTASRFPRRMGRQYVRALKGLGVEGVQVLDIRHAADAAKPGYLAAVESADLIFFTGGDQTRLARILCDTPVLTEVVRAWQRGATLAGTSAGAAVMSDPLIFDGQDHGLRKGRVRHEPGFGLLPGVTVDTHFVQRARYCRLAQFLSSGRSRRGLGLSENTGLIVPADGICRVTGAGPVVIMSSEGMTFSDFEAVEQDRPVSMAGLTIGYLAEGIGFDLRRWCVTEG